VIRRVRAELKISRGFLPARARSAWALLLLMGPGSALHAAPKLDIGSEYRIRGVQLNNPTYSSEEPIGTQSTFNQDYYSHRARIYMKGKLDPGIEIASVIQAVGVAGSTAALLNRYPREDFTPFIENAYARANEMWGWPVSVTVGRQPFSWGSGMLVSDDGLGFDGIRLDLGPFWGIRTNFLTAKVSDALVGGNRDLDLAGLEYDWGIHNIKLGYILETDKTGSQYTSLAATNPVTADKIKRSFIDMQLSGRFEQGAFYRAEYAMQGGKVNLRSPLARDQAVKDITLSGSALTFEGGFDFIHPRYRRMVLAFVFMQGSGDASSSLDKDERFLPSHGRRHDGLEPLGAGEFFGATPYSFFNEDRVVVSNPVSGGGLQSFPYRVLFSGLRTFGFRGSVNPLEGLVAGLEFYLYTAREIPDIRQGAPTTITENALGRELVISFNYTYSKRIQFGLKWGKFFASQALNDKGSSRLTFEAAGRF